MLLQVVEISLRINTVVTWSPRGRLPCYARKPCALLLLQDPRAQVASSQERPPLIQNLVGVAGGIGGHGAWCRGIGCG